VSSFGIVNKEPILLQFATHFFPLYCIDCIYIGFLLKLLFTLRVTRYTYVVIPHFIRTADIFVSVL